MKLKITLLQMAMESNEPEKNLLRAKNMINNALEQKKKPDLLVLPEMWTTGENAEFIKSSKYQELARKALEQMSCIARKHSVNIIAGSMMGKKVGGIYNSSYVINRKGSIIATYDQVHIQRRKFSILSAGCKAITFNVDGICCGIILGHDLRFPEFVRQLALLGAKVLFVPGMWPRPREIHWELLNVVRAIENQFYVVAVNWAGETADAVYPGMSLVADPWGQLIIEGGNSETILNTVIDTSIVDKARAQNPIFSDRRPEVYNN